MNINNRGLIGTITVHFLVLLLLLLGGLTFPDPPPEEEGILVNFGTDDTGFGLLEPRGDEANQGAPDLEIPENSETETVEQPITETTVKESKPADNTQDVEVVAVKEERNPSAEEIKQQQLETERIRKAQEEAAEKKRLEEERIKKEQQATRLNSLGRNTFGRQGEGEEDGSQGVNPGSGTNQGTVTGSPGATNYGDGSGLGNGTSYGLGSRKAVGELPLPDVDNCNVTSRIVVTVEIQVDRTGTVVSANVSSATFADNCIWNVVVQAAKKTKFTSDESASLKQTGWIKYTIEP